MKKVMALFAVLAICFSCADEQKLNNEEEIASNVTLLNGHITNYNLQDSIYEIPIYIHDWVEGQQEFKTAIDSVGNFSISLPIDNQQDIGVYYKNWLKVIVKGGEKLDLSFDGSKKITSEVYASAHVTGKSENINNTLFNYMAGNPINMSNFYETSNAMEPTEYKAYYDSIYDRKNKYIDAFITENELPVELKTWIQVERDIEPIETLLAYKMFNPMARKYPDQIKSNDFLATINETPRLKEVMFVNSSLASFANYYTYDRYTTYLDQQTIEVTRENVDSLRLASLTTSNKDNPVLQQLTVNEYLKNKFANNELEVYNDNKSLFNTIVKGSFFEEKHLAKVQEIEKLLANPELSDKSELLSFNTEDSKKYIDEIIENANGKVVYIDHWATWCGPCRSEFKNSTPALKEKFKGQVEFVYFCYQSPEKNWKPMISKYNIEGKHYFIEKDDNEDLFKQVNLEGFPTYTIINKNGEIVESNFEYRPSNPETSLILQKLIEEN